MNEVGKIAYQTAQVFSYISLKRCLSKKDGEEPILLDGVDSRKEVLKCFESIVEQNTLSDVSPAEAGEIVKRIVIEANATTPPLYENTLCLIGIMNYANWVCKMYYVDFPKSKKLLTLVNQLAKICPPALETIFGDDMPVEYRNIWPHLSSLIEFYRANG